MELDEIDKLNFTFITFRAHVSEPQVFEDFISFFLPHISLKFPFYIYSIEADDTPSRHIHILLQHDEKETQKLKQKIENKQFKLFVKSLAEKQTDIKCALKYGRFSDGPDEETFGFTMKIEDKMKCIGYIFKDITRRNKTDGISQDVITQSCDFYFANRRIKNQSQSDWITITTKNIHSKIEQYCKENNQDVNSPVLHQSMVRDKHTFVQITPKQRKMAIAELKYYNGNDSFEIQQDLDGEKIEHPDAQNWVTDKEKYERWKVIDKENFKLRVENFEKDQRIKELERQIKDLKSN